MTETILANATLVLPAETLRGHIRLRDGIVADIAGARSCPPAPSTAAAIWCCRG